ncbi:molecular chaperone TorD family protein [Thalassobacillus devorans]|uniref:molecular chaperone TorD family protein n=1 Tax=Thalassobacillus devorans TaxID=279813 RepID=UPI000A1CB740|nr:molecular chaperone TorD family protein [Thalassobacillus devorans]
MLTIEERNGQLLLTQLFTHIWFGEWDHYEKVLNQLPDELKESFPFHPYYNREDFELWYENYFSIPGVYFIPPYVSSYTEKTEEAIDRSRQDLLCLIGKFEEMGFYYPIEKGEFPDHIGSLTAFLSAAATEEIKAEQEGNTELARQLRNAQLDMYQSHIKQGLKKVARHSKRKLEDPFFSVFIPYYLDTMKELFDTHK